MAKQAPASL